MIREMTGTDLERLRRARREGRAVGWTAPARPTQPGPPLPEFRPQRPDAVFRQMMDHLQKWARASKEDWLVNVALFRKHNGTAVAHMTDEQLYLMLKDKVEESLKVAYSKLGRSRELQIKVGGF